MNDTLLVAKLLALKSNANVVSTKLNQVCCGRNLDIAWRFLDEEGVLVDRAMVEVNVRYIHLSEQVHDVVEVHTLSVF